MIPRFGRGVRQFQRHQQDLAQELDRLLDSPCPPGGFLGGLQAVAGGHLSREEIRDNAAFFFLVVVRTLVSLFRNVGHCLAAEPAWQERLRDGRQADDSLHRIRSLPCLSGWRGPMWNWTGFRCAGVSSC